MPRDRRLIEMLGAEAARARHLGGMGLRELARAAGVPVGTLHNWMGAGIDGTKKIGNPRFTQVARVMLVLDLDLRRIVEQWAKSEKTNGKSP